MDPKQNLQNSEREPQNNQPTTNSSQGNIAPETLSHFPVPNPVQPIPQARPTEFSARQPSAQENTYTSYNSQLGIHPNINKKKLIVSISTVVIALICCMGYVIYSLMSEPKKPEKAEEPKSSYVTSNNEEDNSKAQQKPIKKSKIKYSKLKTVNTNDGKLSISVPKELQTIYSGEDGSLYAHKKPNKPAKIDAYSAVYLGSAFYGAETINQIKPIIIKQMNDRSGEVYEGFIQGFKDQGTESFNIQKISNFKGGLKIVISDVVDQNNNKGDGVALILFSKDTYYVITVTADKEVWEVNQETFEGIVNSISFK